MEYAQIDFIINNYNKKYSNDRDILNGLQKVKQVMRRFGEKHPKTLNPELLNYENILKSNLPSGKTLGCLLCWYRQEATGVEVPSDQPAAIVRTLKQRGFEFARDKEYFTLKGCNGEIVRKIVGWSKPPENSTTDWNKLSKKDYEVLRRIFPYDFFGFPTKKIEIDHREPQIISQKKGNSFHVADRQSILNGNFFDHFQVISKIGNSTKREICSNCQQGHKIERYGAYCLLDSAYISLYDEINGCQGCYLYNNISPAYIRNLNG